MEKFKPPSLEELKLISVFKGQIIRTASCSNHVGGWSDDQTTDTNGTMFFEVQDVARGLFLSSLYRHEATGCKEQPRISLSVKGDLQGEYSGQINEVLIIQE